jgi:hypothetical protein
MLKSSVKTAPARKALHRHHDDRVKLLKQLLNAYQTNYTKAQATIDSLTKQLGAALREQSNNDMMISHSERVYLDIIKNHGRAPLARRYCVDPLAWAEECWSLQWSRSHPQVTHENVFRTAPIIISLPENGHRQS